MRYEVKFILRSYQVEADGESDAIEKAKEVLMNDHGIWLHHHVVSVDVKKV